MENNQRVNRRCRSNFPAELNVEIVDCLPVDNAVRFLANVPNRLIFHHCVTRVRRMFEKRIPQIVNDYASKLPVVNWYGLIWLRNGHQYTGDMNTFLRYGGTYCNWFAILRGTGPGLVAYPADFFNNLIKYYYQTKVPAKAVRRLFIDLSLENSAPWPAVLLQPQTGEMKVEKLKVEIDAKRVSYSLYNKHNPKVKFNLYIEFEGDAECYQQMTRFVVHIYTYV